LKRNEKEPQRAALSRMWDFEMLPFHSAGKGNSADSETKNVS